MPLYTVFVNLMPFLVRIILTSAYVEFGTQKQLKMKLFHKKRFHSKAETAGKIFLCYMAETHSSMRHTNIGSK